jgi:hypothetical protein
MIIYDLRLIGALLTHCISEEANREPLGRNRLPFDNSAGSPAGVGEHTNCAMGTLNDQQTNKAIQDLARHFLDLPHATLEPRATAVGSFGGSIEQASSSTETERCSRCTDTIT